MLDDSRGISQEESTEMVRKDENDQQLLYSGMFEDSDDS
jgi:hypothetical protein